MNIKVLNISNNNNMGDIILGETAVFLVNSLLQEQGDSKNVVERIEVIPCKSDLLKHHFFDLLFGRAVQLFSLLFKNNTQYRIYNVGAKIKASNYYKRQFKNADAIIIAEGAFKYSLQDFSYYFEIINKIATKRHIPVMLNAMSIEKANSTDYRYHQLKRVANMDSVKLITTRDGAAGVDMLIKDYGITLSKCAYVGDTAFWIPECYNICRNEKSTIYGIGIMAPDVFVQNGFDLPENNVRAFYIDLIRCLQKRNIDFRLFTNGLGGDYDFTLELIDEMKLDQNLLLDKPNSPFDFINMISGFKAIIGARMHACITAFSLGVPLVGLVWHNKLKAFAKTMILDEYFFDSDNLNPDLIIQKMLEASYSDLQLSQREFYKNRTRDYIYEFLSKYLSV